MDTVTGYHFVGKTLRDGSAIPADGVWLEHVGSLALCESGLHFSLHPFDALQYAPGRTLCFVEVGGEIIYDADKGVASRRKIIRRSDVTSILWEFARWRALQVIHLWDAPEVVREYLETGNEELRAVAGYAVRAAAEDAAWDAAGAAAGAAQREKFLAMVLASDLHS